MVKIQVNSQGKAYYTTGGKVLLASSGGDTVEAINNTGAAISADDKVYIAPLSTPQSGANYEIVPVKTTDSFGFGFYTIGANGWPIPTINLADKSASDFTQYGYLDVPKIFDYTQPWEFNICFQTGSSVGSGWITIFTGDVGAYENSGMMIQLWDTKITVILTYGDANDRIVNFNNYPVTTNTTYYVRVGWTGTEYYVMYSTDGLTWTSETPVTSSVQPVQNCSKMRIGNFNGDSYFANGKVFLDKTYFISNGEIVWQAMYDGTWSNIGKDVVTGIAAESIASGSVGEVSTVLGE